MDSTSTLNQIAPSSSASFCLVIKVYFENTLRRFSIPWDGALLFQMNDLRARIINFFNFRYDDDDWSEAIRQRINPLRIYVRLNSNIGSRSRSTSADVGEIPEPISDARNPPVVITRHPNFPFVDLNDTPSWESELETQVLTPTLDLLANHGLPGSSGDPIPPIDNVSDFPSASSILVSQENVGGSTNKDGETDSLHGRSGDSVPIDQKEPAEQSDTAIDLPVTGHKFSSCSSRDAYCSLLPGQ